MAANSTNSSSDPGPQVVTLSLITGNTTTQNSSSEAAASTSHREGSGSTGTAVAVTIVLILVTAVLIFAYVYLTKKGKQIRLPCWTRLKRSRISSTSSIRRALEQEEVDSNVRVNNRIENASDMFTIDDFDDNVETHDGREEYFYDEVFGQSQFEDETTNNSMRRLYSDHSSQPENYEMLDEGFETIRMEEDSCTSDSATKNVA